MKIEIQFFILSAQPSQPASPAQPSPAQPSQPASPPPCRPPVRLGGGVVSYSAFWGFC